MKKYSEFTKGNLDEGFFSNFFGRIGSFIRGDKDKISEYVGRMIEVEKDFINKSDELNYNIFIGDYKISQDPSFAINTKQKAMMSRRAIDSMKIAKDSEIGLLSKKIASICNNNQKLEEFYYAKKVEADSIIAKYAYEKAKRFKDQEYSEQFYNQWKELESQNIKTKEFFSTYGKKEKYWETKDIDYDLAKFEYNPDRFRDYIKDLSSKDLKILLEDGMAMKIELEERLQGVFFMLKYKKPSFEDPDSYYSWKQKNEDLKEIYRIKIATVNNKINILKDKLKYKK
jgi:hypothetical protein